MTDDILQWHETDYRMTCTPLKMSLPPDVNILFAFEQEITLRNGQVKVADGCGYQRRIVEPLGTWGIWWISRVISLTTIACNVRLASERLRG